MDPIIEVRDLVKRYDGGGKPTVALKGISLSVMKSEFVAIMGPSGSGKSTLMNILGCLDIASEGIYVLEGCDVFSLEEDELAYLRSMRIGFVFQSYNLLPKLSVLQNVMLPLKYAGVPKRDRDNVAVEALLSASLAPDLFDKSVSLLSGGQMQRVAIARALVNDPPLILADEPTGNLDSATGAAVLDSFSKLQNDGKTILLITHDPGVAKRADRILKIEDGVLFEGGVA